jgi:hypothetical protein
MIDKTKLRAWKALAEEGCTILVYDDPNYCVKHKRDILNCDAPRLVAFEEAVLALIEALENAENLVLNLIQAVDECQGLECECSSSDAYKQARLELGLEPP